MENESAKEPVKETGKSDLIKFAYDLGISICIPLIILVAIGIWLDKKFETKPVFIIACLLLSLITTGISINKKIKNFKL